MDGESLTTEGLLNLGKGLYKIKVNVLFNLYPLPINILEC